MSGNMNHKDGKEEDFEVDGDDDDDAATTDSLDGLVASVVDDTFESSLYFLDAGNSRPTSAPLPVQVQNWIEDPSLLLLGNGLTNLSLSGPTSPSRHHPQSRFDFSTSTTTTASSSSPRFMPPWQQQQHHHHHHHSASPPWSPPPPPVPIPAAAAAAAIPSPTTTTANNNNAPLEHMTGRFLQLSQEQNGCRYLQSRIAKEGSFGAHLVLKEVFPLLPDLMIDPFANYMYQKLLDVASVDQRLQMLEQVRSNLLQASLNLHGTRSVQKHIEVASQAERMVLALELQPFVIRMSMDTNGNHVIQRMLQHFPSSECEFIFRAVIQDLLIVARHRHGCCVVQRSLDASRSPLRDMLIERIETHCLPLMQDAFANYTVQYVLDMNRSGCCNIQRNIVGHLEQLSKQKFSSNVVEKCILMAPPFLLDQYSAECIQCMSALLLDAFGNFVVQRLLDVCGEVQARRLVQAMRPFLLQLNPACSKRVASKICKRFPDMTGDPVIQQIIQTPPTAAQQQQRRLM